MKTQQSSSMVISFGLEFPGTYPLIITGRQCMGTYKGSPIYRVTSMRFLNCNRSLQNSTSQEVWTWFHSSLYVFYLNCKVLTYRICRDWIGCTACQSPYGSYRSAFARAVLCNSGKSSQDFCSHMLFAHSSFLTHTFRYVAEAGRGTFFGTFEVTGENSWPLLFIWLWFNTQVSLFKS
jgi:hypothetical protein